MALQPQRAISNNEYITNFKVYKISQSINKLTQTLILIIYIYNNGYDSFSQAIKIYS